MNPLGIHPDQATFWQIVQFLGPKVLYAVVCGGIIGLERELKSKAAGIKTNMLICVGSALFTSISVMIPTFFVDQDKGVGDPGRLAAQIVSGIGFLGGGAIIQARGTIVGLTTAATIWVVAALGVCIGVGFPLTAVTLSVFVVLVLVVITYIESRFMSHANAFECQIVMKHDDNVRKNVIRSLERYHLSINDFDLEDDDKGNDVLILRYRGVEGDHNRFLLSLWSIPGVKKVRQ